MAHNSPNLLFGIFLVTIIFLFFCRKMFLAGRYLSFDLL